MASVFGLDFGTTNSAMALGKNGATEILRIDPHSPSPNILRSILYFGEGRRSYVGHEAIHHYLEEGGSGRLMQSIKSLLPSDSFQSTVIHRRPYDLETLISIILKTMKERGEMVGGSTIDSVVMGRPAFFSADEKKDHLAAERLRAAAALAGFREIRFEYEPVAAAMTYEESLDSSAEKVVLVGDLGGGTSDFSIMKVRGGKHLPDRRSDVLALAGVYVGGDTFDGRIMWSKVVRYFGLNAHYRSLTDEWLETPRHLFVTMCQWHLIPRLREEKGMIREMRARSDDPTALRRLEHIIEDNYGFVLFRAIEKAKIELSSRETSSIMFSERDLLIDDPITRMEFEAVIDDASKKLEATVEEAFQQAGLTPGSIDAVILTGGSSQVPKIRNSFVKRFGADKLVPTNALTSVVYGLGLSASRT